MNAHGAGDMGPVFINRIESLRMRMRESGLESFLVTNPQNRHYLSGFTGSAGSVLATHDSAFILVDSRYVQQAKEQCPGFVVVKYEVLIESLLDLFRENHLDRVSFEPAQVSFKEYSAWTDKEAGIAWEPAGPLVEELRIVKSKQELSRIEAAVRMADDGFIHILDLIKPGVNERDLAVELEYHLKKMGSDQMPFEIIVAAGERGALPHATPTTRKIKQGDLVVLDFGVMVDGYCSDMTRTVCVGKADSRQREIYDLVARAQRAGLEAIRHGVPAISVDGAARDVIREAGYGENFGHGLGHGVGLAVHEEPRLSPRSEAELRSGMVVTDEPGVYIEGWGGIRIEDMVVVEEAGGRALTGSEHGLIEL